MPINFLSGFAETQPRGLFSRALLGQRKEVRDFFEPRFNELYNEYLAGLAAQPQQSFGGFLGGVNFSNRLGTFSPQQRGDYSARTLTPRTRSFLNF